MAPDRRNRQRLRIGHARDLHPVVVDLEVEVVVARHDQRREFDPLQRRVQVDQ